MTDPVEIVYGISGPIGYTVSFSAVDHVTPAFASLFAELTRAQKATERARAADECHHCGAPSPGDVCRYCSTVHRRQRP